MDRGQWDNAQGKLCPGPRTWALLLFDLSPREGGRKGRILQLLWLLQLLLLLLQIWVNK